MKALLSRLAVEFELTHNLERLETLLKASRTSLCLNANRPFGINDDFAVVYRYELMFQVRPPDRAEFIETVRLIREHVVARIAALSTAP